MLPGYSQRQSKLWNVRPTPSKKGFTRCPRNTFRLSSGKPTQQLLPILLITIIFKRKAEEEKKIGDCTSICLEKFESYSSQTSVFFFNELILLTGSKMFLEHLSCFRKLARALRKEGMGETCFRSDYMVFLTQG